MPIFTPEFWEDVCALGLMLALGAIVAWLGTGSYYERKLAKANTRCEEQYRDVRRAVREIDAVCSILDGWYICSAKNGQTFVIKPKGEKL